MSFLDESDIARLTGIKRGSAGETKNALRVQQLRQMGVPFRINARGEPVVTWEAINGSSLSPVKTSWMPGLFKKAS